MRHAVMRHYGYTDCTIAVACGDPSDRAWLDEFLSPSFTTTPTSAADFVVTVDCERDGYEQASRTRPSAGVAEVGCFRQDRKTTRRSAWDDASGMVVEDPKHRIRLRLAPGRVDILLHPAPQRLRVETMRVLRELASCRALGDPERILLHAAAIEHDGRAVLLAGPKEAGKTTVLCYLAAATGTAIIANDRVLVGRDRGTFEARGMPSIASVRPPTARLLAPRFAPLPTVERPFRFTLRELASLPSSGAVDPALALKLSPAQLACRLGVALAGSARLAAIVFPEAQPRGRGHLIERLPVADARARLRQARFGIRSGQDSATVFDRLAARPRPAGADEAMLASLAGETPCFRVAVDEAAFAEERAGRAILTACLDG